MPRPVLPPEAELVPTQAADPRPRLEEPTDRDVPTPLLEGMVDLPVPDDGVVIEIGGD